MAFRGTMTIAPIHVPMEADSVFKVVGKPAFYHLSGLAPHLSPRLLLSFHIPSLISR